MLGVAGIVVDFHLNWKRIWFLYKGGPTFCLFLECSMNSHACFYFCVLHVLKVFRLDKSALNASLWCCLCLRLWDVPLVSPQIGLYWAMPDFHSASSRSPKKMAQGGAVHFVTTSIDHELLSCAKSPVWLLQKRGLQPPSCFLPIPSCSQGKCSPWLCDPYNQKRRPPERAGWKTNPHKIHISNHQLFSFYS